MSKTTDQFSEYVNTLFLENATKEALTSPDLYHSHSFYLNLIPLLTENGKNDINIPAAKLEKLGIASYLYFRALLVYDHMTDSQTEATEKKTNLYLFFSFFERSAAELGRLYENSNPFWQYFEACKLEYFSTTLLEKQWSQKRPAITEVVFKKIASGKSAVCNAIVYALNGLMPKDFQHTPDWLECLQHLHIGFQYLDDLDDFKKDGIEQQWTYTHSQVEEAIKEQGHDLSAVSSDAKYRYLFLSGIAVRNLENAIDHFRLAKTIAAKTQLHRLVTFITSKEERCRNQIREISLLIEKTKDKAKKSTDHLQARTIQHSTTAGIDFMAGSLQEDGYWRDFLTSAGFGRDWITAYVVLQLSDIPGNEALIAKASEQLLSRTGAAYNENIIADADSINFFIWMQNNRGVNVPEATVVNWRSFMHSNGGWATYNNELSLREKLGLDKGVSVAGWLMPHNCVSAVAACVLSFMEINEAYDDTIGYLLKQQHDEGYISSYWWTSPIYATSFSLMALSKTKKHADAAARMACWLSNIQNSDGCWYNPAVNEPSALYTALAMKALLQFNDKHYTEEIQKGAEWLLRNQTGDGSWPTNRVLLLPATNVIQLETVEQWRKSSFGVNVIIDDHNRVFTTATVLNTLHLYEQKYSLIHAS
ncbi:hypothetical protein HQN86_14870 [Pedobacter panaciterrae]|uniref:hypothetical protein n=1 Tax=Pedobacter panaciterrae TaxID=363849 RepID=UPI00155DC00B|nr:hypothetical protein [Pedobacter panaciterrae]NQX54902.1 hypothetical protein [Pedobacter panaciterrae]